MVRLSYGWPTLREKIRTARTQAHDAVREYLPAQQIIVRRDTHSSMFLLELGTWTQVGILLMAVVGLGWGIYTTVFFGLNEHRLSEKEDELHRMKVVHNSLLGRVDSYQDKFHASSLKLEENYTFMLGLIEKNTSLQESLENARARITRFQNKEQATLEEQARLSEDLARTRNSIVHLSADARSVRDELSKARTRIDVLKNDKSHLNNEVTHAKRQARTLENRLGDLQKQQMSAVMRVATLTEKSADNLKEIIEKTGVGDSYLANVLKDIPRRELALVSTDDADGNGQANGQGGPFVAADGSNSGDELRQGLSLLDERVQELKTLQDTIARFPLAVPLDSYRITSAYGKRRDPINNHWAMHYGLDFASYKKAPVYVTAPGKVVYAGWKGSLGKVVQVNHGNGIVTRYAHLDKVLVKRGQKVAFFDKVGLLGSTGRSTGPHLHYEIIVRGRPLNPMQFIKAGRYVFQEE